MIQSQVPTDRCKLYEICEILGVLHGPFRSSLGGPYMLWCTGANDIFVYLCLLVYLLKKPYTRVIIKQLPTHPSLHCIFFMKMSKAYHFLLLASKTPFIDLRIGNANMQKEVMGNALHISTSAALYKCAYSGVLSLSPFLWDWQRCSPKRKFQTPCTFLLTMALYRTCPLSRVYQTVLIKFKYICG